MAASKGFLRTSSSANLTADSAVRSVQRDSSSTAWLSASALITCCSASARSASASFNLNSCSVVSNCTTVSPGLTNSPAARRNVMATSLPPVIGAVSISEFPPWSSPRAETVRVTRPRFTRVVGSSPAGDAPATLAKRMAPQANAPTTPSTTTGMNRTLSFMASSSYFFASFSTSTSATSEPEGSPLTATSSGFRASTCTSTRR